MHPRPGDLDPGDDPGARRRRDGRGAAQHEPRDTRGPRADVPHGAPGLGRRPATASGSSPTCRGRRSGSAGSPRGRSACSQGQAWTITTRDVDGRPHDLPARRTRDSRATCRSATRSSSTTARCGCGSPVSRAPTCTPRSIVGGRVSDHKGINLPGVAVSVPALSEKDIEDLRFALRLTVDFVALSFVRSASDVDDVRRVMDEVGVHLPVIAKIEKPQAVDNLDEIDRRLRRDHGGAWRPRRGVPARGRPVHPEAA